MLGVTIYGEKMRIEKEGEEECDMLGEVSNIHKPFFLLKGGRYDVDVLAVHSSSRRRDEP
jgi:hypothetical protein